jgi:hypothetical protein
VNQERISQEKPTAPNKPFELDAPVLAQIKSRNQPRLCRTRARAFSGYLHSARLSCEAMICHVPPRFSHVSVQTWQTFAFGSDLSLPT